MKPEDNAPEPEEAPEPNPERRLRPHERTALTEFINRKASDTADPCPVCGSGFNIVVENFYRVDVMTDPVMIAPSFQPLVSTVCHNCGYVRFFNHNIVNTLMERERAASGEGDDGD